jgi:LmbE family N-acetylglucosaminyl deacetylase/SAM-dependent methyltransferase
MNRPLPDHLLIIAAKMCNHGYGMYHRQDFSRRQQNVWLAFDKVPVQKIVILIPHMDDEIIGCGGLLMLAATRHWPVCCIYVTDGAFGFSGTARSARSQRRALESERATSMLGKIEKRYFLNLPDGEEWLQTCDRTQLLQILEDEQPSHLLLPYAEDTHIDHRQTLMLYHSICHRLAPPPATIYYQIRVPIPQQDINLFLDFSAKLKFKRQALRCFISQKEIDMKLLLHLQACQSYLAGLPGRGIEVFKAISPEGLDNDARLLRPSKPAVTRYRDVWTAIQPARERADGHHDSASPALIRGWNLFVSRMRDFASHLGYTRFPRTYFEKIYAKTSDPWEYETSPYEQTKRDALFSTLSIKRWQRALEIGCSIGMNTERLALLSDSVVAIDISGRATVRAQQRCRHLPHVTVRRKNLFHCKEVDFDLVLCSEILYYYWDPPILRQKLFDVLLQLLAMHGCLVVVWGGFRLEQDWNAFLTQREELELISTSYYQDDVRPYRISVFERLK